MQHNHGDIQHNHVNTRDDSVNMRLQLYWMSKELFCMLTYISHMFIGKIIMLHVDIILYVGAEVFHYTLYFKKIQGIKIILQNQLHYFFLSKFTKSKWGIESVVGILSLL